MKSRHISVLFPGLTKYKKKYTTQKCCNWFSQHQNSPKREIIQLLSAIETQNKPNSQLWVIEVSDEE